MSILAKLVQEGALLSPATRAPLRLDGGGIVDGTRPIGPVAGPLNLLRHASAGADAAAVDPGDVARMRDQLELAASPEVDREVARAIAETATRYDEDHLSAEAHVLAERFRIPAFRLAAGTARRAPPRWLAWLFPAALEYRSDSLGARIQGGAPTWRSVRVRNPSRRALAAAGPGAAHVEARWRREGDAAVVATDTTALPVDLAPGREITLVLRLAPPAAPGGYQVDFCLVRAGARRAFHRRAFEVVEQPLPVFAHERNAEIGSYAADHHVAMEVAAAYLAGRGHAPARLLEIGGGVHPTGHSLALRGHEVVSCDISHSQSILGTLYFREKMPQLEGRLAFVSCDGTDLPFAPATFDGVVMFAAFHHFAAPVALLREIRRVLRPGGFVFLGCEPCDPNPADEEYRAELRRGINEQMWTLEEYDQFFRAAGLAVAQARVDGQSLKVALVPA